MTTREERSKELLEMDITLAMRTCKHHIGTAYTMVCKAGVDRVKEFGAECNIPCLSGTPNCCSKAEFKSREEVLAKFGFTGWG